MCIVYNCFKLRHYLIFILFLLAGSSAFADDAPEYKVDSLKTLIGGSLQKNQGSNDTLSINRINKLASEFIDLNPDSALYYGQLAIDRSNTIKYQQGVASGLLQMAKVYILKGSYERAQKNLDEARIISIKSGDNKLLSDCLLIYGNMYYRISNYNMASDYMKQALALKIREKDEAGIADSYHSMGMIANNTGRSSLALDYYFKSLLLDIKLRNQLAAAKNYNNIGVIMQDMEIYPKSLEYYKKAIKIWQGMDNIQGISTAYENIGEILMIQKKYDQAIVYLSKSMELTKQQDDKDGITSLYTDLGLCYANKKQYNTALSYIRQALQLSDDYKIDYNKAYAYIGFATVYNQQKNYLDAYKYAVLGTVLSDKLGNLAIRTNAALQLSIALGGLNRFEEAYTAQKKYNDLKDSLKSDESVQKLTSFNLESNFAEKQQRVLEQNQRKDDLYQQKIQRQRLLSAIFFIIILGMSCIAIIYYRSKRKQQNINAILEEKNKEVLQQKTDLNEQAVKLNDLNVLKDRLISVLAHDLRAPLSTLRGLFSLLEDDSISHEQFLQMIPQALKKLEYTSDFLDTLLFWINSQMDNFDRTSKSFAVKDVVAFEITGYYEQAAAKGINLIDNVPDNIAVSADPDSVRIVIRNLITNAIKFSRKNDSITISAAYRNDNYTLITIKDTGIGMPEKQLNKLFKSKVDSGTGTNNEAGTGMGLLFCKDLIEKCNGKIWVTSEPGNGTEFSFILPVGTLQEKDLVLAS